MTDDIQTQARSILDTPTFSPFDQGLRITRSFPHLPPRPGIYAIRHRILYLGKTNQLNIRFSTGHKAFTWAWLDRYSPDDVRIAINPLDRCRLLSEIEAILLRATEPPYNARIPMES